MPASHERVPNTPLNGSELRKIILNDVQHILDRDGMFTRNIAFPRVSYEVRVTVHMGNPLYPEHISTTMSKPAAKQHIEKDPARAALELGGPLVDSTEEDSTLYSEERHREISSPNAARIENGLPITIQKRNLQTNQLETKEISYTGDVDQEAVGNKTKDYSTVVDATNEYNGRKKGGKR